MKVSRREVIVTPPAVAALAGCLTADTSISSADDENVVFEDRLYTCSYDGTAFGLDDGGDAPIERWHKIGLEGQVRDILPDREGNVVLVDDDGLHKWAEGEDGMDRAWTYERINGSVRGVTIDYENDYYVGSWTSNQGFHKVVEDDDGEPTQAWIYEWDDDTGMITAANDHRKRLAVALKNGDVHLVADVDGEPELLWRWTPGTGEIMREVLWDPDGALYVGSEDHHLYKLVETDSSEPSVAWSYDAGNLIYGVSITLEDDIYLATNDGAVHFLREVDGEPERQWVYQHTSYDGTAPTDEIFFDGLAHQVAVRPDNSEIYSCGYDGTTHKIEDDGGEPRQIWEHNRHDDNVREVRIHNEYLGANPEHWDVETDTYTGSD